MTNRRAFLQSAPAVGAALLTAQSAMLAPSKAQAQTVVTSSGLISSRPRSYRGDFDDRTVEAPNGAMVNGDYFNAITAQPGEATIFTPTEGVWAIVGYMIANFTFVQGETGLIAFDTGNNTGMARDVLALLRTVTDLPIVAIIYSHHHYTAGTAEYLRQAGRDLPIYGHPDVDNNLFLTAGALGPMQLRRSSIQLGFYLPHEGPDAGFGFNEPTFDTPELQENGHRPVTHPVADGEEVVIDGLRVVFHHAVGDTRDSLIVHFPEKDMVLHNTNVIPVAYPLSTLRGDFYRVPTDMIASIDRMRAIRPGILIGCHGTPLLGDEAYEVMTAHRDYYAFIYNQSVRAINQGKTPDEMADEIEIPPHLAEHPWLFPAYVEHEFNIRGIYRGVVGWYAEDTADLHPPTDAELGGVMIEGFGGIDTMIDRAQVAMDERKYNLAAKMMTYAIAADPGNTAALALKANALRAMGQAAQAGIQARNFLLTHALHLEGEIDWTQPPEIGFFTPPGVELVLASPPGTYLKLLEFIVDPVASADVNAVARVSFSDLDRSWTVHVRRGVIEVTEVVPETVDVAIDLTRETWARIALREMTLADAIEAGGATVSGDKAILETIIRSFDELPTSQPEPEHMNW